MTLTVREATAADRAWLRSLIAASWSLPVVSTSGVHDPDALPALVAEALGERAGALTYRVDGDGMEVVTMNSVRPGRGAGHALLEAARALARARNLRLWLVTTDDNPGAIRFYEREGMRLVARHRDLVDMVRRAKPWPGPPGAGDYGFRDGLEFADPVSPER